MIRTKRRAFPLSRVYQLLEPGPVVLVTTARGRTRNVMAQSWHTMMEFEPPLIGCVISNRNYSFGLLRSTGECAIGIPAANLVKEVVGVGNVSGRTTDKFARFGLTPIAASTVKPPLIAECWANLECRVADSRLANRYNFFVLEVLAAWIDPSHKNPTTLHHRGNGVFMLAGRSIRTSSKMR